MVVAVKVTPGMWRAVRAAATSAALNHAFVAAHVSESRRGAPGFVGCVGMPAPKISKGVAVPRPTEMLVYSMRPRAG